MDPDKIIILPERQNPILANRIKYYESPAIVKIHKAQEGRAFPFPNEDKNHKSVTMAQVRESAGKTHALELDRVHETSRELQTQKPASTGIAQAKRRTGSFKGKGADAKKLSGAAQSRVKAMSNECADILESWSAENPAEQKGSVTA
jgi:type IV secretion system protein VirD4